MRRTGPIKNYDYINGIRSVLNDEPSEPLSFDVTAKTGKDSTSYNHLSFIKPLNIQPVQQLVFKRLFNAIVAGAIPPGTKITTYEVSKAFKVSQAPVRVAMNWLEAKGYIISRRKKGSFVRELTIEELNEIIYVRLLLESAAMELSYKVCTKETLSLLESINEHYKRADTFEESYNFNRVFHQTLYRDANRPLLVRLITNLYDKFSPYATIAFTNTSRIAKKDLHQQVPGYHHTKILEGMRMKNLGEILKNIKEDLESGLSL